MFNKSERIVGSYCLRFDGFASKLGQQTPGLQSMWSGMRREVIRGKWRDQSIHSAKLQGHELSSKLSSRREEAVDDQNVPGYQHVDTLATGLGGD
ncbi:hypothetical protein F2P81_005040 [Scophthalmus maximus]|uniref:Uncharacterized protein n=1 Tax=Scophthalmus maximus TaxID=52904 RepID=A0A6A4TCG8_SCOMX|nr:hypothetical protein F2P81_005040 [Scophthalmus maximus]